MFSKTATTIGVMALLASAGCKKNAPPSAGTATATQAPAAATAAPGAHCDSIALSSTCREYRAMAVQAAGEDSLRSLCMTLGQNTFGPGACPTADLVGTCELPEHIEHYYSRGPAAFTAQTAQQACASGLTAGTFRAGP